jgi:hypothetical protein
MTRRSIDIMSSGMMVVKKKIKKDLGGGKLGLRQVRRTFNIVKNPRLLKINQCMASELAGKTFPTLGAVQSAFAKARKEVCKV